MKNARGRFFNGTCVIDATARLLVGIGEDPGREGLLDTPARVARAWREFMAGYDMDPAAILSTCFDSDCDQMVVVRDVPFWSLCEHHLLPFKGRVTLGYLPRGRVVGLSKLARLVECFARRLQIQERLTSDIETALRTHLAPHGAGVVVHAEHLCMVMRGVQKTGEFITSALSGGMREDARTRAEFLRLAGME